MGVFFTSSWSASDDFRSTYEPEEADPDRRPHRPSVRWASVPPAIGAATAQSFIIGCGVDGCDWSHAWTFWSGEDPSTVTFDEVNGVVAAHHERDH